MRQVKQGQGRSSGPSVPANQRVLCAVLNPPGSAGPAGVSVVLSRHREGAGGCRQGDAIPGYAFGGHLRAKRSMGLSSPPGPCFSVLPPPLTGGPRTAGTAAPLKGTRSVLLLQGFLRLPRAETRLSAFGPDRPGPASLWDASGGARAGTSGGAGVPAARVTLTASQAEPRDKGTAPDAISSTHARSAAPRPEPGGGGTEAGRSGMGRERRVER